MAIYKRIQIRTYRAGKYPEELSSVNKNQKKKTKTQFFFAECLMRI